MHAEPTALRDARRAHRRARLHPRNGGPHRLARGRRQPRRDPPERRADLPRDARGPPRRPDHDHVRQLHLRGRRHRGPDGRRARRAMPGRGQGARPARRGGLEPDAPPPLDRDGERGLRGGLVPLAQPVRDQAHQPPQPPPHPRGGRPGRLHRRHRRGRAVDRRRTPARSLAPDRRAGGGPDRALPAGGVRGELAGRHRDAAGRRRVLSGPPGPRRPRHPVREELARERRRGGVPAVPARHRRGPIVDLPHQSPHPTASPTRRGPPPW